MGEKKRKQGEVEERGEAAEVKSDKLIQLKLSRNLIDMPHLSFLAV